MGDNGIERTIFHATMSLAQFPFLLCCLRFDSFETRKERVKTNKLTVVSNLFGEFVHQISQRQVRGILSPRFHLTVDEMQIPFVGRCSFRMLRSNTPEMT